MKLRALLKRKEALVIPGVYNAATALLAQDAGFKAIYVSGAAISNSCGLPDTGLLSMEEVAWLSSYIIAAVKIPVIIDADTGYGGLKETRQCVRLFEEAGASAVQIEDQESPKRCGHLSGKSVVSTKEFCEKIKVACKARRSKDTLIIARTDVRAAEGIDGAIERARAYIEAGADVVFPEALKTRAEFAVFSSAIKAPLIANMTEFGVTPYIKAAEFRKMKYAGVIFPVTAFRAGMRAAKEVFAELSSKGSQAGILKKLETRSAINRLLNYDPRKC